MATPGDLLALALTKVGYRYSQGPTRTTGQDGYFDCSGFTYFLLEHFGVRPPEWEAQSHLQALYDRDHGLLLSVDEAIRTPGALLYEGPQHAYVGGAGIPGHVAVSLGNGSTVEAMGRAWGTCIGRAAGRGWSNAGRFPNVDYSAGGPAPAHPDPVEGPQLGDDMSAVVPARAEYFNSGPLQGRKPFFSLDFQAGNVLGHNGAELKWRGPKTKIEVYLGVNVYDVPIAGPFLDMMEGEIVRVVTLKDGEVFKVVQKDNTLTVLAGDGGVATADIILP